MSEKNVKGNAATVGVSADEIAALKAKIAKKAEGLAVRSDDVVGYWLADRAPFFGKTVGVKLFDSNIDPAKPSALITAVAEEPTVIEDAATKLERLAKPGENVGIWYKPGMKDIRMTAGVSMCIQADGEKNVGKASPMKCFKVQANGGSLLPITEDKRVKSAHVQTPFDVKQAPMNGEGSHGPAAEDLAF